MHVVCKYYFPFSVMRWWYTANFKGYKNKFSRHARLEVFTVVKIHFEVFWFVTSCSVTVGYQCFRSLCCLHLQVKCWDSKVLLDEDGGSEVFWSVGILRQNYTGSQPRRFELEICQGIWHCSIPVFTWNNWESHQTTTDKTTAAPSEPWTGHFQNRIQKL